MPWEGCASWLWHLLGRITFSVRQYNFLALPELSDECIWLRMYRAIQNSNGVRRRLFCHFFFFCSSSLRFFFFFFFLRGGGSVFCLLRGLCFVFVAFHGYLPIFRRRKLIILPYPKFRFSSIYATVTIQSVVNGPPLRKHASSNILRILPPKKMKTIRWKILIFFLFLLKT